MPGSRSDEPLPKSNSAGPGAAAAAAAAAACIAGTCPAHMACRARASLHWQCAWQKPSHWAGAVATCAVPNATGQAASAPCRSTLPAHLPTLAWARTWHIVKCWLPTTAQSSDAHQRLASAEVPLQHSPVICAERSAGQAQRRSRRAESCHKAAQAGVQRPQLCRQPAPSGRIVWGQPRCAAAAKPLGLTCLPQLDQLMRQLIMERVQQGLAQQRCTVYAVACQLQVGSQRRKARGQPQAG